MTESATTEATAKVPAIEVTDLGVDFWVEGEWVTAAKNVSYTLHGGDVLAIVGESGSGKSTSAMGLLGLLPENGRISGSVKLAGEELVGASLHRLRQLRGAGIAVIFQEPMTALNPVYTIGFQIVEALQVHNAGMLRVDAKKRALELLAMVELPDPQKAFDSYPHQLSGGQRQRAMIAQSISCDPRVLIADEPTTALDVTVQAEILELLHHLRSKLDSAIILITHDMGVVADLADRVMVMKDGEVVETGTADSLFAGATHPYTQALLAAVPHLGEAGEASASKDDREVVVTMTNVAIEYPKRGRVPAFRAADNINLTIRQGEVLGLVGESGSGKTTIGRAVVGLLPAVEGTLDIVGTNMVGINKAKLRAVRRDIGIVFQDPGSSLNPRMPIGESIGEPMRLGGGFSRKDEEARVSLLLDRVQLSSHMRNRYPHELSGGQRQRVGIARALALSPKLLVADEPTSALDVSVQAKVLELFQELQKELGFACLFVTHDLAVIDILADRIAVMHRGKIVEQGTRDQVLRSPKEEYTQRLIAAVPLPDPEEQRRRRAEREGLFS
ncbi:ABC transporter ATP-binding protein [Salinibacterium sp. NSLL150]|uniref:ABC transporter ATP-binding protein n=1 Tax=unclassified Salinibacterium TaxID=2632331 RepID=UPI0018CD8000|nr:MULTISPECIES: ABC transporter ATP-binding protein [unclassified Salinibacterium]MBH0099702.1 ABC transporter ATP-binding protein [Salinibacterium sp. NSLL35]MBH0102456.1 ABC transporter ATP-binding protein [Salinibacterium sp. NSLL150]MBH0105216.1 ABC transporter ATP-binding protein [Salinibacterium sp. NSLL16]MBH0107976.1 ABC transporter ATP-binding protein [Salinibacterium sp. NSLL17]MBH0110739.1 ABC transporter ATP-binding protein [Salinibacterium sp. NG22]